MLTQPHIIVGRIHAVHTVASLKLIALATRGELSAGKHGTFISKDLFSKVRKCGKTHQVHRKKAN